MSTTEAPTAGKAIEQTLDKLGAAAHDTARDLGAAVGSATDKALQNLGPTVDAAQRAAEQAARDLGIAAGTVQQGCGGGLSASWSALWEGNFGTAFQLFGQASASCADSVVASVMALFPWFG